MAATATTNVLFLHRLPRLLSAFTAAPSRPIYGFAASSSTTEKKEAVGRGRMEELLQQFMAAHTSLHGGPAAAVHALLFRVRPREFDDAISAAGRGGGAREELAFHQRFGEDDGQQPIRLPHGHLRLLSTCSQGMACIGVEHDAVEG